MRYARHFGFTACCHLCLLLEYRSRAPVKYNFLGQRDIFPGWRCGDSGSFGICFVFSASLISAPCHNWSKYHMPVCIDKRYVIFKPITARGRCLKTVLKKYTVWVIAQVYVLAVTFNTQTSHTTTFFSLPQCFFLHNVLQTFFYNQIWDTCWCEPMAKFGWQCMNSL